MAHRELPQTLQFPLAQSSFYKDIERIVLAFTARNFTVLVDSHCSQQFLSSYFQWKGADKAAVCYLPGTEQQTDKVTDYLVNTVEHLAAKEIGKKKILDLQSCIY